MEGIESLITNMGFPITVTIFLLIRLEKKLDELNKIIIDMFESLINKLN